MITKNQKTKTSAISENSYNKIYSFLKKNSSRKTGVVSVSIDDIVETLGISKRTVYRAFEKMKYDKVLKTTSMYVISK